MLDLERLKISPLPGDLTEFDIECALRQWPKLYGDILLRAARKAKHNRTTTFRCREIYSPMAEHLLKLIGSNWNPRRPEVAAYCAFKEAMNSRKARDRQKWIDQAHRVLGLNVSTLKLEADVPAAELVAKWKKELEQARFGEPILIDVTPIPASNGAPKPLNP